MMTGGKAQVLVLGPVCDGRDAFAPRRASRRQGQLDRYARGFEQGVFSVIPRLPADPLLAGADRAAVLEPDR